MDIDIKKYLDRIKFTGELRVDLETLKSLHRHHLYNVPFENLDVIAKKQIELKPKKLEEKIILNNRGGFCYELNGLFYCLLKQIGFKIKRISGRVFNKEGIPGEEFDHLALIVTLEEEWLVDVGFGENFIEPIKFKKDLIQKDETGYYCIQQYDQKYFVLKHSKDMLNFENKYLFTPKARYFDEFEKMCKFHSTSPDSPFTQKRLTSILKKDGRTTISGDKFIHTVKTLKDEANIQDDEEFRKLLKNKFNIKFD